jgi:spore germination protein GerM
MVKRHTILSVITPIALLFWSCSVFMAGCQDSSDKTQEKQPAQTEENSLKDSVVVHLYFSDRENSYLIAENRHILHPDNPVALGTQILDALLEGPQKSLARTIPEQTRLKAFYIAPNHVAFVDLSADVAENHPGGATSEMLTIYSIVNSLILNIPEIEAVKLLIDGKEAVTLAGHIDLRSPLKANMLLIR